MRHWDFAVSDWPMFWDTYRMCFRLNNLTCDFWSIRNPDFLSQNMSQSEIAKSQCRMFSTALSWFCTRATWDTRFLMFGHSWGHNILVLRISHVAYLRQPWCVLRIAPPVAYFFYVNSLWRHLAPLYKYFDWHPCWNRRENIIIRTMKQKMTIL
jgi:hypothetical protein